MLGAKVRLQGGHHNNVVRMVESKCQNLDAVARRFDKQLPVPVMGWPQYVIDCVNPMVEFIPCKCLE